jgi:CheY-like chemotaxis protein
MPNNRHIDRHAAALEHKQAAAMLKPELTAYAVLVVDDDPVQVELCSILLEAQGFSVLAAGGPVEAISIAARVGSELDAAILDYNMPLMNGCRLARHLRTICPELRIVLRSATIDVPCIGMEYVDAFIEKTAGVQALIQSLRNAEGYARSPHHS